MTETKEQAMHVGGRDFSYWYDRRIRLWTIVERDANDNQIGEASYTSTRPATDNVLALTGLVAL